MSETITLRSMMARPADAFNQSIRLAALLILCFSAFAAFAALAAIARHSDEAPSIVDVALSTPAFPAEQVIDAEPVPSRVDQASAALTPRMQAALDDVRRRYQKSTEALLPVFEVAQQVGQERRIDPLLIVAVIGIESNFNPFAESHMGAQGLMQVIPRFHRDKLPEEAKKTARPFFNPDINIRVGTRVLEEAIRRRGGVVPGLQSYAGYTQPEGRYATRVLAEKARLEKAARKMPANDAPQA